jgi:hypothetical protein
MNTYEDVDVIIYMNVKTMYHIIFKLTQWFYVVSFIGHNKEYFGWERGAPHQHVKNVPNGINKFTLLLFHKFVMISSIVPYDVPIILCSYIPNDFTWGPKVPNDFTCFLFIQIFHTFQVLLSPQLSLSNVVLSHEKEKWEHQNQRTLPWNKWTS